MMMTIIYIFLNVLWLNYLFISSIIYLDAELTRRICALASFVTASHLDVPAELESAQSRAWAAAATQLARVDEYRAPRDKMVCVVNACNVINGALGSVNIILLKLKNLDHCMTEYFTNFIINIIIWPGRSRRVYPRTHLRPPARQSRSSPLKPLVHCALPTQWRLDSAPWILFNRASLRCNLRHHTNASRAYGKF